MFLSNLKTKAIFFNLVQNQKMSQKFKNAAKFAQLAKHSAVYNKTNSPLRGFEFVENITDPAASNLSLRPENAKPKGKIPNARFQYAEDQTTYNSYQSYVEEATKARWSYNNDKENGWWLTLKDVNAKRSQFYVPEMVWRGLENSQPTNGQKYRMTKKNRIEIEKKLTAEKPNTTSKINALIDLDQLSAIDFHCQDTESRDPDVQITGEYYRQQIPKILSMYGIFKDLKIERFTAQENFQVSFAGNHHFNFGNKIMPQLMQTAPTYNYFQDSAVYTTALISLDSGIDQQKCYLHHLVHDNQEEASFLKFFPFRGTGYHRVVALTWKNLEKQTVEENFSQYFGLNCNSLKKRQFSLFEDGNQENQENVRSLEDNLIGIKMINTRWDPSVSETCKNDLQIREPVFDYQHKEQMHDSAQPLTKYTEAHKSSKVIELSMAEEEIYPGLGQPDDYQTSSGWNEFNGAASHRRRKAGK